MLAAQGNWTEALAACEAGLGISERLAGDVTNASSQRNLAQALGRAALVEAQRGERRRALDLFTRGREITERLRQASPTDAMLPRDLALFDEEIAKLK